MKKTLLFIFAVSFFFGCSVEPMDPYLEESFDQDLKMTAEDNDCVSVHNFGDAGTITVTNDGNHLLLTIAATGDFSLTDARLQVSNSFNDFPTVGRGNLPPGKMEIHKIFKDGVQEETWKLPLGTGSVVIASFAEFTNTEGALTAWAGDKEVKFGNWAYFEYEIIDCPPPCTTPPDLGEDVLKNLTYAQSLELNSEEDLLEVFGLDVEEFPADGDFEPSLESLLQKIQNNTGDQSEKFSTTYTVGEGECTASKLLSIKVAKCIDAGADNSITVDYRPILYPDRWLVVKAYHELLESYPSNEDYTYDADDFPGTFEPTIDEIISQYQSWKKGDRCEAIALTTTYTVTNDNYNCEDSAELTIEVSPDPDRECPLES